MALSLEGRKHSRGGGAQASPAGGRRSRSPRRRSRVAVVAALATVAVLTTPGTASASLAEVGPTADNGYPAWYRDASGLTLRLCDDPASGCTMAEVPNPNAPVSFPENYAGEAFYFAAASESASYEAALEAAFVNGAAAVGENIVFSRVRIRLDGLVTGETYHITHPYGVLDLVAQAGKDGGTINYTDDGGCLQTPCDYQTTLDHFVGDQSATSMNFLTRVGFDPTAAQEGAEIGDPLTPTEVQGSPFDTNLFRVEGPNAGGPGVDVFEETRFTIEGQVYGPTDPNRPSTPDLAAASDSGRSSIDNITTVTTPTFTGTAPAGSPVELIVGGAVVGTIAADLEGRYSVAPDAALTAGNKAVRVRIPNPAYDPEVDPEAPPTLESGVLNMQIDQSAPTVTIGSPRPTNGTIDNTPTFVFSTNEVGATMECQLTRGAVVAAPYESCTSPLTYDEQPNGSYRFEVRATDLAGNVTNPAASHSWFIGPVVVAPGAPGTPTATGGDAQATVSWTAPTSGDPVESYTVRAFAENGTQVSGSATTTGTSATVTGLTNGTPYTFDVVAANAGGSATSARSGPVTPAAPVIAPGAPTIGTVTPGNASATVTWSAPTTGGDPTSYSVQVLNSAGTLQRTVSGIAATATSTTVTGLTNGTSYRFRVRGVNAAGNGALSAQSVTVTPSAATAAPVVTSRSPVDGETGVAVGANVTATFSVPVTGVRGGTTNPSFELRRVSNNARVGAAVSYNATTRTATLNPGANLAAGVQYTATLVGGATTIRSTTGAVPLATQSWTFTTAAQTATVPARPAAPVATAGVAGGAITASATWTAPADGGSPITGYRIRALRMSTTGTVLQTITSAVQPAAARSITMTLPQTGNYRFTVQAINAVGNSQQSPRSNQVAGR